jgi:hypothetical protein
MNRRDFLGTNLLASLPEDQRSFNLKAVSPGNWWLI